MIKKMILLSVFPIIMVIALILSALSYSASTILTAEAAKGQDGLLYTDYFTGDAAHQEWEFGSLELSGEPAISDGCMQFTGTAGIPGFAMLHYTLPEKFDMYFTAETVRRGEGTNRNAAVFFNVGKLYQNRYALYFEENTLRLSYNSEEAALTERRVGSMIVRQPNSFRISVDGSSLKVYMDGAQEPDLVFNASGKYENFANARTFGIACGANEFIFDNLVVTDGSCLSPCREGMTSSV